MNSRILTLVSGALAVALTVLGLLAQDEAAFQAALAGRYKPERSAFQFGLIGDQQYNADQEARFPSVLRAMDAEPLRFVVHDGDIKGGQRCTDALYQNRFALFDASAHPFILTPGDNDWTDCHSAGLGGFDPIERLAVLRKVFYADPRKSMGKTKLELTSQADQTGFQQYPENALWAMGEVVFATFHAVGSNNGFGRTPESDAEFRARNQANLKWISTAFALARTNRFRAVMLITQANPRFDLASSSPQRAGFNDMNALLSSEVKNFPGPVVLVHGDTHYFRIDKPLPEGPRSGTTASQQNFTRVETFGPPDLYWLRVRVVPQDPNLFVFEPQVMK